MSLEAILKRVAGEVTPSASRRRAVSSVLERVIAGFERATATVKVKPSIRVGGSFAHDTWLPTDTDVDVFMLYPKEVEREEFERSGLELAERALADHSPVRRYAEHPYIEARLDQVIVNAVPCYDVPRGGWLSAADRSPHHTSYMQAKLTEGHKAQVRILKQFMRAQGLYGAEIKVRGFSGYACEVLTLKYGTFLSFVTEAARWSRGQVVSLEGGEERASLLFRDAPLIILDPVDTTRNLASAVSPEKLGELIFLSRSFLASPSYSFFRERKLKPLDSPPRHIVDNTLLLRFDYRDKSEDILWGELWKTAEGLAKHLEKDGLHVLRYTISAREGRAAVAFLISSLDLPEVLYRRGPDIFMAEAVSNFMASAARCSDSWWMGDDLRVRTVARADAHTAVDLITKYMKNPVGTVGFARGLADDAISTYDVLAGPRAYSSRRATDREALGQLAGYRFG